MTVGVRQESLFRMLKTRFAIYIIGAQNQRVHQQLVARWPNWITAAHSGSADTHKFELISMHMRHYIVPRFYLRFNRSNNVPWHLYTVMTKKRGTEIANQSRHTLRSLSCQYSSRRSFLTIFP